MYTYRYAVFDWICVYSKYQNASCNRDTGYIPKYIGVDCQFTGWSSRRDYGKKCYKVRQLYQYDLYIYSGEQYLWSVWLKAADSGFWRDISAGFDHMGIDSVQWIQISEVWQDQGIV